MTRLQRLEKKGWKITISMQTGEAFAYKGNQTIKGTSISDLHKKIIGY